MRSGIQCWLVATCYELTFGAAQLPLGRRDLADAQVYKFHSGEVEQTGGAEKYQSSARTPSKSTAQDEVKADKTHVVIVCIVLGLIVLLPLGCLLGSVVERWDNLGGQEDAKRSDEDTLTALSETLNDYWAGFIACLRKGDLPTEKQIIVISYMRETSKAREWEMANRFHGQSIHVLQAVAGAMVPILIPISQTYADSYFGAGKNLTYGQIIALIAVAISLLGSTLQVLDRLLAKAREMTVNGRRARLLKYEIAQYTTLSGDYAAKGSTGEPPSHLRKYAQFNARASEIMLSSYEDELNVFASSIEANMTTETESEQQLKEAKEASKSEQQLKEAKEASKSEQQLKEAKEASK